VSGAAGLQAGQDRGSTSPWNTPSARARNKDTAAGWGGRGHRGTRAGTCHTAVQRVVCLGAGRRAGAGAWGQQRPVQAVKRRLSVKGLYRWGDPRRRLHGTPRHAYSPQHQDLYKCETPDGRTVINTQWGTGTVRYAAVGLSPRWIMRCVRRSPRYTTRWDELVVVR